MRWGEATALAVKDVDLDADVPVVHVLGRLGSTPTAKPRAAGPPQD